MWERTQKSPIFYLKEPYLLPQKAIFSSQKSPIFYPKEPYLLANRALSSTQKLRIYSKVRRCAKMCQDVPRCVPNRGTHLLCLLLYPKEPKRALFWIEEVALMGRK